MSEELPRVKREPTSIKIDPVLWKQAKIEAIRRDIDLSELVEIALRKEIKESLQNEARAASVDDDTRKLASKYDKSKK